MANIFYFAQKALILDKTRTKVLLGKYLDSIYNLHIIGKLFLPGGRMEFGENPEEASDREIKEEVGVKVKQLELLNRWTWKFKRGEDNVQIVAIGVLCEYLSGEILEPEPETDVKIEKAKWYNLADIDEANLIEVEIEAFRKVRGKLDRKQNAGRRKQ